MAKKKTKAAASPHAVNDKVQILNMNITGIVKAELEDLTAVWDGASLIWVRTEDVAVLP